MWKDVREMRMNAVGKRLEVGICVMRKGNKVNICVIFHLSGCEGEICGVIVRVWFYV